MRVTTGVLVATIALAIGSLPAGAVEETLRFGRIAKLKDKDGTGKDQVIVKFVKESGLTAALPSPLCPQVSAIRLTTDLQEVVIPLDCSFWAATGSGFAYKDKTGSAGGVSKINFFTKPTGGKMLIKIKGEQYGAQAIGGPIASLEVELAVGADTYCGRFAPPNSPFIKNEAEQILIKGPSDDCIPEPTPTHTITLTPTVTVTRTPTATATITSTATITPTATDTPTVTATPTVTNTVPVGSTPTFTPVPVAFRVDSLALRDPHVFAPVFGSCFNVTNPPGLLDISANGQLVELIEQDGDLDGLLDLNILALLRPLAQPPASGGTIEIRTGECTVPFGGETCSPDATPPQTSTYTNQASGTCLTPQVGTTGPGNSGSYSPALVTSAAPCFATTPVTLSFSFGLFTIPLQDLRASATFVGTPADQLIDGLLIGFLSESDANTILLPPELPLIGNQPVSILLPGGAGNCAPHTAKDFGPGGQPGWYFHLNFSAHEVTWTGP